MRRALRLNFCLALLCVSSAFAQTFNPGQPYGIIADTSPQLCVQGGNTFVCSTGVLVSGTPGVFTNSGAPYGSGTFPVTLAESNAGVAANVVAPSYPPGNAFRYGCKGDGVADDTACLQADIKQASDVSTSTPGMVYLPHPSVRYRVSTGNLTVQNSITIYGDGKYSTPIRFDQSGGACFITTGTANQTNLQVTVRDLTIELNQNNLCGIDASRFISSTIRSVRVAATGGATGTTGISANITNNAWTSFFNVVDDFTADGIATGIFLQSNQANKPNRWRITATTCLSVTTACYDGEAVSGAQMDGTYCDQQLAACIKLGSLADGVTITDLTQETAAGGYIFDINPSANRVTLLGYRNYAGTLYKSGNGILGTRGVLLGQWDDGLQWTDTATTGTITAITQANPAVITINTVSGTNPYSVNEQVAVSGVNGMTQINGLTSTVSAVGGSSGAWTITTGINAGAFSAYTSGGTLTTGFIVLNTMVPSAQTLSVSKSPLAVPAFNIGDSTNATTNETVGNLTVAVGQKFISNAAELYPTVGTNPMHIGTFGNATLGLWTNDSQRISIAGGGAISINSAFASASTTFTLGSGTGACATTSTLTGAGQAGSFLCTGTAGASTQVVNLPTSPNGHGWACWASDDTSGVGWAAKSNSTTAVTLSGTIGTTSDKVVFGCLGY